MGLGTSCTGDVLHLRVGFRALAAPDIKNGE